MSGAQKVYFYGTGVPADHAREIPKLKLEKTLSGGDLGAFLV